MPSKDLTWVESFNLAMLQILEDEANLGMLDPQVIYGPSINSLSAVFAEPGYARDRVTVRSTSAKDMHDAWWCG